MLASQLLYSTIVNRSGGPLHVNFVGVSGRTLADNESVSQFGTLFDWVRDGSFGFWVGARRQQLEALITAGSIAVLQTPSVVLRDVEVPEVSYMLETDDAVLAIVPVQTGEKGTAIIVGP